MLRANIRDCCLTIRKIWTIIKIVLSCRHNYIKYTNFDIIWNCKSSSLGFNTYMLAKKLTKLLTKLKFTKTYSFINFTSLI